MERRTKVLALVAHDNMKHDLAEWVRQYAPRMGHIVFFRLAGICLRPILLFGFAKITDIPVLCSLLQDIFSSATF